MKNEISNPEPDILDIIFASRNKAYGAYALRREYPLTFLKAGVFTVSLIAALYVALSFIPKELLVEDFAPGVEDVCLCLPLEFSASQQLNLEGMRVRRTNIAVRRFMPSIIVRDQDYWVLVDDGDWQEPMEKMDPDPAPTPESITLAFANDTITPTDSLYDFYEPLYPGFPGGEAALMAYLAQNMVYPPEALKSGLEAMVPVQFTIDTAGCIQDVIALRDPGQGLAEEAVRVVKTFPPWIPAEEFDGHPVRTRYVLPVRFRLEK